MFKNFFQAVKAIFFTPTKSETKQEKAILVTDPLIIKTISSKMDELDYAAMEKRMKNLEIHVLAQISKFTILMEENKELLLRSCVTSEEILKYIEDNIAAGYEGDLEEEDEPALSPPSGNPKKNFN